ncbi:hypothetical protein ACFE04_000128 [Oxalis oulophora]
MDPIMKLLEEDEDESMHSGADVEAFQAQLNRDISGDGDGDDVTPSAPAAAAASASQPSNSETPPGLSQRTSHISSRSLTQWPKPVQPKLESELKQHTSPAVNQRPTPQQVQGKPVLPQATGLRVINKVPVPLREPNRTISQGSESQYAKLQKISNQQSSGNDQAGNPIMRGKQVPFALLMPTLLSQLDADKGMQLDTLYNKLKNSEIAKESFVRFMKNIVGDQMLRMALSIVQNQVNSKQILSQTRQPVRMPSPGTGSTPLPVPQPLAQLQQKISNSPVVSSHIRPSAVQMKAGPTVENSVPQSQQLDSQNSLGLQVNQMSPSSMDVVKCEKNQVSLPIAGLSKQQQNHLHFPQSSFPSHRNNGGGYKPYSSTNINTPVQPIRPYQQSIGSTVAGRPIQATPKLERQNSTNDPNRVQGSPLSQFTTNSVLLPNSVSRQASTNKDHSPAPLSSSMAYVKREPVDQGLGGSSSQVDQPIENSERKPSRVDSSGSTGIVRENSESTSTPMDSKVLSSARIPPVSSPVMINARMPQKKAISGQKKPLETPDSLPPSKKQKTGAPVSDQIDQLHQLNDVTAVPGVNIREEEEHLFSGPKEDSRVSAASQRIVQEEEKQLILQKRPLEKKLAQIMAKCGLKSVSNDAERCLSLCVEERLRGLLSNVIRLSKQRVDTEKHRHRTLITSDVREQIIRMNLKAKEEWEKKQAEAEKIRKLNQPDSDNGADGDKEKDEGRSKSTKGNRDDDDKMRATETNKRIRKASGGDDMLSKWQDLAEQARQKREEGNDSVSGSRPGNDMIHKSMSTSGRNIKDSQLVEKIGIINSPTSGSSRRIGRNLETRVARSICVKDVIAVLEREPQMSKSTLIYALYNRVR